MGVELTIAVYRRRSFVKNQGSTMTNLNKRKIRTTAGRTTIQYKLRPSEIPISYFLKGMPTYGLCFLPNLAAAVVSEAFRIYCASSRK